MTAGRGLVFWTFLLVLVMATVEGCSFLFARRGLNWFDHRDWSLRRLTQTEFDRFKRLRASDVLGWDNPTAPLTLPTCTGEELVHGYNEDRVRLHGTRPPRDATVLVAGDSFAHGNDVADNDTYPAALERILGVPVANLGVSGYGPDQALLKLEGAIDRFPNARIVVLSMIHENAIRVMNSYWSMLYPNAGIVFGLKPYMRDGEFHGLLRPEPFRDLASMRATAELAFDTDYWRRARWRFPYSLSVAEAIMQPAVWFPIATRLAGFFGRSHYDLLYRLPSVQVNYRALFERFANWTTARGLRGVVVTIPNSSLDRTSGQLIASLASPSARDKLGFVDVTIDNWSRYMAGGCNHPTPEGYRTIAERLAEVLQPMIAEVEAAPAAGR